MLVVFKLDNRKKRGKLDRGLKAALWTSDTSVQRLSHSHTSPQMFYIASRACRNPHVAFFRYLFIFYYINDFFHSVQFWKVSFSARFCAMYSFI